MLSDKEKQEMLTDARSHKRRHSFQQLAKKKPPQEPNLDHYLAFLKSSNIK